MTVLLPPPQFCQNAMTVFINTAIQRPALGVEECEQSVYVTRASRCVERVSDGAMERFWLPECWICTKNAALLLF